MISQPQSTITSGAIPAPSSSIYQTSIATGTIVVITNQPVPAARR